MQMVVGTLFSSTLQGCMMVYDSVLTKERFISLSNLEQSVYHQVNEYRQSLGLTALELNAQVTQQARRHSQAMATGTVPFSHEGFEQRVKAIGERVLFLSAAENVAYNHRV